MTEIIVHCSSCIRKTIIISISRTKKRLTNIKYDYENNRAAKNMDHKFRFSSFGGEGCALVFKNLVLSRFPSS